MARAVRVRERPGRSARLCAKLVRRRAEGDEAPVEVTPQTLAASHRSPVMPTTVPSPIPEEHERLLASLNDRQREAVTAPDGPTLVIGGLGSGKIRVICARIAHLVRTGRAEPRHIAAVTFTRKAADEMAHPLQTMLPPAELQRVWSSTFQRPCGRLLRDHGEAIGVPADFRIVERAERIGVMRQCMFDASVDIRIHKPQALLHAHQHDQKPHAHAGRPRRLGR